MLCAVSLAPIISHAQTNSNDSLARSFVAPPESARPWVYWYFMDGNVTREGLHADLEAMKAAGIGGAIYLEVGIGVPRGPVAFMSEEWQELFGYAVSEAKRLGIQIALGAGPGWTGSGGPWVKTEDSMQHIVSSETKVSGPTRFEAVLPRPQPRTPFFGEGTLTPALREKWLGFYRDEAVLAFPTPQGNARIEDIDHKANYYRAPYSSAPGTPPRIPVPAEFPAVPKSQSIDASKVLVLTPKLAADGRLTWDVPEGDWTIMRFGRTPTGVTTRPAPEPGLGFETDKFTRSALDEHLASYAGKLFDTVGSPLHNANGGLTMLHFDSWEMSAQNWSPAFRREFTTRRGYDPIKYLPAISGHVVDSVEKSERFLWDLRQTGAELIYENHAQRLKEYAHSHGLSFSVEPYDMNPSADMDLGAVADFPMGEFWSKGFGFDSEYSVYEAVSIGHTNGKRVIGAESFTSDSGDAWLQHPGSMKAQLDWALCAGLNKFVIHRYQHQPALDKFPGMGMGPYGVHWERTQTWWSMVPAFHKYMTRTSEMLRAGLPVNDILYLTPEGAPQVFTPPSSALTSGLPDKKGYAFDGCSPKTLVERASVQNGQIIFPDGVSYRVLVMPQWETMTPHLLNKIAQLARAGATIVGTPPQQSPSLADYPRADAQVQKVASQLWDNSASRKVGKGRVVRAIPEPIAPLDDARWIWFDEGNPASSAPVATRYFRTNLTIAPNRKISSAMASMTADNTFELFVNGTKILGGDNFHQVQSVDIAPYLRAGANEIQVVATNIGDAPGPAGLLGNLSVNFADGTTQNLPTSTSWSAAQASDGPWSAAKDLGTFNMAPWGVTNPPAPLYQSYDATAKLLQSLGVAPDFSADEPMRFIHRKLNNGDLYFVANSSAQPIETTATFRTAGNAPAWWNPIDGTMRALPDYQSSNGTTRLPLKLAAYESGFVIFRTSNPKTQRGGNFPQRRIIATLNAPWNVSFDPRWGGPKSVRFDRLDDWSKRAEEGIKYYSGQAVYKTSFDAPANLSNNSGYSLALGEVRDLASVKLNGRDLGVIWCSPWRVNIPAGVLKPQNNQLEITVANLWVNRLIGDSGKPEAQRLTSTTFQPFRPDSPLQTSGLLGPVTVEVEL